MMLYYFLDIKNENDICLIKRKKVGEKWLKIVMNPFLKCNGKMR